MGWEIELNKHPGFMGGLERNNSTGKSAIYYSNVSTEIIYHISTKIPVSEDNGIITKVFTFLFFLMF